MARFVDTQPTMGPLSLWLRAPFAALGQLGNDSELLLYRLGAFACLLATGLIAVWLSRRAAELGAGLWAQFALIGLLLANPMVFRALDLGHPEEPLGAALAAAAIVAAGTRGPAVAGALLGLAIATKQWGLLAAGPALIAAPAPARRPLAAWAACTAIVLALPLAAGNPSRFLDANRDAVSPHASATPANVWWPLAHAVADPRLAPGTERLEPPASVRAVAHLIVLAAMLAASAVLLVRPPPRPLETALALAAALFLLRCVLDPYTFSYHHVPFIAALATYEVAGRRRLPLLTALACGLLSYFTWHVASPLHPDRMNIVYVAGTLPFLALLAWLTRRARPCSARSASSRR